MNWFFKSTRWGLFVRAVGDKPDAARAMGISVWGVRTLSIMAGSFLAGIGGAYLSLFYPGSWTEMVSGGQGMMAVAPVHLVVGQRHRRATRCAPFDAVGGRRGARQR